MHPKNILNSRGDNIEPCFKPFFSLNELVTPSLVLIQASAPMYKFLIRFRKLEGTPL